jgi:hypothetical protein
LISYGIKSYFHTEHAASSKLSSLLAPFEFELLSRKIINQIKINSLDFFILLGNKEQFADKTELPHALLHVNNRLYCMYSDEVLFVIRK